MQDLKKITIAPSTTIQEALGLFGHHDGLRILIIEHDNDFIGIITEQDIRRGLLQGLKTHDPITSIINTSPVIAYENTSKTELLALASKHNAYDIPIIDSHGKIIRIDSVFKLLQTQTFSNPVVIMAGGLGSRLKPLTDTLPKPMLKVGKKPILQIILERFQQQGFQNIILCVNYKSHIIEEYFGDGSEFGLNITYIKEEKQLGTAGALSLIPNYNNEDFFVMNGDILTDIDFAQMLQMHIENSSHATMGIREYELQIPYGVVKISQNKIQSIEEKPTLSYNVSAGIYILNPKVLKLVPKNQFFDMPNLFEKLIQVGRYNIKSYLIEDYWIDIGRKEEYEKANIEAEEI